MVTDPDPDAQIRSAWRCYRACLEALGDEPGLVVQDDAIAVTGFMAACERAVQLRPDRLISFFHGGTPPIIPHLMRQAHRGGELFIELPRGGWCPTVCLFWPAGAATAMLDFIDHERKPLGRHWRADDSLVGEWARRSGRGAVQTVPCLVEHPDDWPSLLGARFRKGANRGRCAAMLAVDCADWAPCCM